ncbi:PepSY-like domain-containing protein [Fibrella arboris]|uniref:PepSY-like domain-containing protein n=1 Tax=Fibrella arboris TaxID=3242486 RepID=UPI0035230D3D
MLQKLIFGLALLIAVAACTQQNTTVDAQTDEASIIASLARLGNPNNATAVTGKPCNETIVAKETVPAAVFTYLAATYPAYVFVQAEQGVDRSGATYYEIQFTLDGKTRQLHFDTTGTLLQGPGNGPKGGGPGGPKGNRTPPIRTVITADKLPAPVTTYMAANFAGYTLVRAEVVTDATTGAVMFYDVRYTLNGKTSELHFDVNGNLQAPPKGHQGPG